jgi:hypothetical protein
MKGGSAIRNLLFALALAAMGARAAAPPGYMFAPSTSGLTVTLCGGETMHVDFGKQNAPAHRNSDHGPCLFAAAAHAAPAPTSAAPAPIFVATTFTPQTPLASRIGQDLAAPPPPSTGPPQLT